MDESSLRRTMRGVNRITRENGPGIAQPQITDFLVLTEVAFLKLVDILQRRGICRCSVSTMVVDMNLGSNAIVHNTVTANPEGQRLSPVEGNGPRDIRQLNPTSDLSPVHAFMSRQKTTFSRLVSMLECSGTLRTSPSLFSVSLTLENTNHSFVLTIPSTTRYVASDIDSDDVRSEPTVNDPAHAAENAAPDHAVNGEANPGAPNVARNEAETPDPVGTAGTDGTEASNPPPVPLPVTPVADEGTLPHVGGTTPAAVVDSHPPVPVVDHGSAIGQRRAVATTAMLRLRGAAAAPQQVVWGPPRAEGYFAQFRRPRP